MKHPLRRSEQPSVPVGLGCAIQLEFVKSVSVRFLNICRNQRRVQNFDMEAGRCSPPC